uniref:Chromosome 1 open reading frame 131 n=1 Tax=Nothobranchius kadleci TaxID=1051664 RepID=A0A1A8BVJ2_NOTKA
MSSNSNKEEDEDFLYLEQVLDSLYDFGSGPQKMLKMKKKKKRKPEEEELPTVKSICTSEDCGAPVSSEHKQQLKTELTGPTPPQVTQVEVVTFQDPRKKRKLKQNTAQNETPSEAPQTAELKQEKQEELSLEQARLEVHRFGITGYKKEQQRVFEQHRAVMLGARPPKKDFVNYKELQRQMKEKKQKEKEEFQPDKKKKKKSNQRDKKKSSSGAGLGSAPSGQVGRFKNGMLVLNPKEIQKIKSNK